MFHPSAPLSSTLAALALCSLIVAGLPLVSGATAASPAPGAPLSPAPRLSVSSFTISPNPILVGQTTYLNLTAVQGTPPYLFNFSSGMPPSCAQTAGIQYANVYSVACIPSVAGSYTILGVVFDSNLSSASSTATLVVNPAPTGPTIQSFTASPASVPQGGTTYLNVSASGGIGPYSYAYTSLPPGCASANTSSLKCIPSQTGNYTPTVTVTDMQNLVASSSTSLTVTVSPGPVVVSFTATPSTFTVGSTTQLRANVSGGSTPYTYSYAGLPAGCGSTNASSLSCRPTGPGNVTVVLTVSDTHARSATAQTTFVVNPLPSVTSFTASPTAVTVGGTTTIRASATGGTPPYGYTYTGLPSGCSTTNASSFGCTPTATGSFTLQVIVRDSDGFSSAAATTAVTVNTLPSVTSFTADPSVFPLENGTYLNVSVAGGTSPFRYVYAGLPAGCSGAGSSSVHCTPLVTGTFNASVTATDASGKAASASVVFTVTPAPLILSFAATPSTVAPHSTTVLVVQAAGGALPYSYTYSSLPTGCGSADTATLSCTPIATGTFEARVVVTDARGNSNFAVTNITVSTNAPSGPAIASFTASPSVASVGQSVEFTVIASGGSLPYSYSYVGLPPDCSSLDASHLNCTPPSPGNYTVKVTVTDGASRSTSATLLLRVTGQVQPLTDSLSVSPTPVPVGRPFTLNASIRGGVGPFAYGWSEDGANNSAGPNATSWTLTLTRAGTYIFRSWVTDATGKRAGSNTVTVEVTGSSGGGGTSSAPASPLWIVGAVVLVALVLLAFLVYRRRQAGSHPPSSDPTPESLPPGGFGGAVAPAAEGAPTGAQLMPEATGAVPAAPLACPQCGAPLDDERTCLSCGVSWQPGPLAAPEAPGPGVPPEAQPEPDVPGTMPTLTLCPTCQRPVGPEGVCYSCGHQG